MADDRVIGSLGIRRMADGLHRLLVPQAAGYAGQYIQLAAFRVQRQDEQEQNIDGPSIDCIELNRPLQSRKDPEGSINAFKVDVWDSNSISHSSGAEGLALVQRLQQRLRITVQF